MKIVSGSFGASGSAYLSRDARLVIEGQARGVYTGDQIGAIEARTEKERRFSIVSFLLGLVVVGGVLTVLFNVIGLLVGIVLAVFGSYYGDSKTIVDVTLTDGKTVALECTPRAVKKLYAFAA